MRHFEIWGFALAVFLEKTSASSLHYSTADGPTEVFQAATPPRPSLADPTCRQTLFTHQFGNSYGAPYVGTYTPPPADCPFTTTVLRLSISAQGRQYDRLAFLYFGDVEVWRTSTAMPTRNGIYWTFDKDVTVFDVLLRHEQKIIFDLGNVVDGRLYTGLWNVSVEALYFSDEYDTGAFRPAEAIYPISNLTAAKGVQSAFSLPSDSGSVSVTLPRNAEMVVVSLTASGNGAEEFWFTNVPTEYVKTFPGNNDWLFGYSPFREVQLLIDGQLAGVSWPFPILFTGGVDPGAWRPIVGIDAFELPSFEIDVTPWLSLLCDGKAHTFQFKVVGFDSSTPDKTGPVGDDWWVAGSIFVWLDKTKSQTMAGSIKIETSAPSFSLKPVVGTVSSPNGSISNSSLYFSLTAKRSLFISSTLETAEGRRDVIWTQNISFSNTQNMTESAFNQSLAMITSGAHTSSASTIISKYTYPLNLFSAYVVSATEPVRSPGSVFCMVDRSKLTEGLSLLPFLTGLSRGPESVATRQNVTSMYHWNDTIVEGTPGLDTCDGDTWYSYEGSPARKVGVVAYSRYLREKDDAITADEAGWTTRVVSPTVPLPHLEGEPEV